MELCVCCIGGFKITKLDSGHANFAMPIDISQDFPDPKEDLTAVSVHLSFLDILMLLQCVILTPSMY